AWRARDRPRRADRRHRTHRRCRLEVRRRARVSRGQPAAGRPGRGRGAGRAHRVPREPGWELGGRSLVSWQEEVEAIRARREIALGMGGPERIARQHARGRLTIRERIDGLVDAGSFTEFGQVAGSSRYDDGALTWFQPDPYVAGLATINGR